MRRFQARLQNRNYFARAFSLIEIVLAVAILGTGVVLILALFPSGIQAGRDVSAGSMAAMIAQDEVNELRRRSTCYGPAVADCPSTPLSLTSPVYYTTDGMKRITSSPSGATASEYYFRVDLTSPASGIPALNRYLVQVSWPINTDSAAAYAVGTVPCANGGWNTPAACSGGAKNYVYFLTEIVQPQQ